MTQRMPHTFSPCREKGSKTMFPLLAQEQKAKVGVTKNLQDFPAENRPPGFFPSTLLPQFPFKNNTFTQKCTHCLYSFHLSVK